MARLRSPVGEGSTCNAEHGRRRERGQLLLVSGFALAVLLLALAVALNAAAYTESSATRPPSVESRDVLAAEHGVERGIADVIRGTNAQRPNATYTERTDLLAANVANWTRLADTHAAADAAAVEVAVTGSTTKGVRVWQGNATRQLVDDDGNATWTVANSVNASRGFALNVSRASLANASCPGGCFAVVVSETQSTRTWRVTLSANATHVVASVDGPSTSGSCAVRGERALVELSAGRLGGDPCPSLSFTDDVVGPYDVDFEHGDAARGSYALVVDESIAMAAFDAPPGPHAHPVAWAAEIEVTYRTPTVTYSRTFWVEPGDDDA